jgi:death-on-curing protein
VRVTFLTLDDVMALHATRIERYGGSLGIRDMGLLQSALAMPAATFGGQFLHSGIHEMAAAYVFHIVKNPPFVDGNKRAGLAAAIAFLELNGHRLDADPDELADTILAVADGTLSKAQLTVFLESRVTRRQPRRRR